MTLIFDLGGVVMTIDPEEALRRFKDLGLKDAEKYLDPYTQNGIFGDLERGRITAEDFRTSLSGLVGHELSMDDCQHAWLGYRKEVPQRNLEALLELRRGGNRVILLSNTNPFMQQWAENDFDGQGNGIGLYFDALYRSYEMKLMKPDEAFFRRVLAIERTLPQDCLFVDDGPRNVARASELGMTTYCPVNGEDWTEWVRNYVKQR